jgi:hypothetical protein
MQIRHTCIDLVEENEKPSARVVTAMLAQMSEPFAKIDSNLIR